MRNYSTAGESVEVIQFTLDGVELSAFKPKKTLLLEMASMIGGASGALEGDAAQQLEVTGDMASICLNLIPKVFFEESRLHLESRLYDPSDVFDVMPSDEHPNRVNLFSILSGLMDDFAGKDAGSTVATKSRSSSRRPPRVSTATSRPKAAASTTGRSPKKG